MTTKKLKNDIRYLLFSEIYNKFQEPKAKRKAFLILEIAIKCYAKKGLDGVTLDMIAREATVSKSLLHHYFQDAADLQVTTLKFVWLLFAKAVVEDMLKAGTPDLILATYIEQCFVFRDTYPAHGRIWCDFLSQCTRDDEFRELNTAAINTGEERIRSLLEIGKQTGFFNFADAASTGRLIQLLISGGLWAAGTENIADRGGFVKMIQTQCLQMAGAKTT